MLSDYLAIVKSIQEGLRTFWENEEILPSMRDILTARLETPLLPGGTDLWKKVLDSQDIIFYGGKNKEGLYRFKVDHGFNIENIVNAELVGGAVPSDSDDYSASTGTEFVIIGKSGIKGDNKDYAIRADKYESIKEKLNQGNYKINALEDGIFIINKNLIPNKLIKYKKSKKIEDLTWDDIQYVNDGWLEHAVGRNGASEDECLEAAKLLARYVLEAKEKDCFGGTRFEGMRFNVNTAEDGFVARHWYLDSSANRSNAHGMDNFYSYGYFLRVPKIAK